MNIPKRFRKMNGLWPPEGWRIFQGVLIRHRTIQVISRKLQETNALIHRYYERAYLPWFEEGLRLGQFWGWNIFNGVNDRKRREKIYYTFEKRDTYGPSCHWDHVERDDYKMKVLTASTKELGLLVGDEDFQNPEAKKWIEKRFRHEAEGIVFRQDLVDLKDKLDKIQEHQYRVSNFYEAMLIDYFKQKHYELIFNKFRHPVLILATVDGQGYRFLAENCELKLFDGDVVTEVI